MCLSLSKTYIYRHVYAQYSRCLITPRTHEDSPQHQYICKYFDRFRNARFVKAHQITPGIIWHATSLKLTRRIMQIDWQSVRHIYNVYQWHHPIFPKHFFMKKSLMHYLKLRNHYCTFPGCNCDTDWPMLHFPACIRSCDIEIYHYDFIIIICLSFSPFSPSLSLYFLASFVPFSF